MNKYNDFLMRGLEKEKEGIKL